jgi:predicted esterase
VLVRREIESPGRERTLVLAIHGHGGSVDQLEPLCRSLGSEVGALLPQAWRPLNIHGIAEQVHPGYSWYFSFAADQPEPATFGDCLIELESLVYDLFEENDQRSLFILGIDQGATLALALAGVVTEFVSGVIAIGGCVPRIKGWSPPVEDLQRLPILLISDTPAEAVSAKHLRGVNANVEVCEQPGALSDPLANAVIVREWIAHHQRRPASIPPPLGDCHRV